MNEEFRYQSAEVRSASPLVRVFSWMALALGITALTSFAMLSLLLSNTISPETYNTILSGSALVLFVTYLWILFSGMLRGRGNPLIPFVLFSGSMGAVLSSLAFMYEVELIGQAFLVSALVFGVFAAYGAYTKSNLTNLGQFITVAFFGAIALMIVNLFAQSAQMDWIVSFSIFGIVLLLVAYQVWWVKQLAMAGELTRNQAIVAALSLYMSFINIFLRVLRYLAFSRRN
jgi:FtsH-binding integral membrane protein